MSTTARSDSKAALLAWGAALLVGAALIRPISDNVAWIATAASYETTHIVAHLFLYGTLAALARAAGLAPMPAAALTLAVAAGQEAVQLLSAPRPRAPGWPEGFDLLVDAAAVALVFGWQRVRRVHKSIEAAPPAVDRPRCSIAAKCGDSPERREISPGRP